MKSTKKALFMSCLSLLLCVSMLVGTTFAWFTDSVTSGTNQIVAGNLDVEVLHTSASVSTPASIADNTSLFRDVNGNAMLWEPGAVSYENFTVANVGTLALTYNMSLNITSYNAVNDEAQKTLKDALKVKILTGSDILTTVDRSTVTSLTWTDAKALDEFTKDGGKLYPAGTTDKASEEAFQVIVYWEPGDNDNLWNVNNGKTTTDGNPLFIDFGINLFATQLTYEEDSFDENYDLGATATITKVEAGATAAETKANVVNALKDAEAGDIVSLPAVEQTIDLTNTTLDASGVTIKGNDDVTVKVSTGGAAPSVNANGVVFDGVNFEFGNQTYNAIRGTVTYKNCTFNGLVNSYDTSVFENCTFNNEGSNYPAHVYAGSATFTNCTFNGNNRCVYVYTDGADAYAKFENCTFTMTSVDKSAVMLNARDNGETYTVEIINCTQTGGNDQGTASPDGADYNYCGLYGFKHKPAAVKGTLTVDGVVVYSNT